MTTDSQTNVISGPARQAVLYHDDAGRMVRVGVLRRYGEHPDLGFESAPQVTPRDVLLAPRNLHLRYIVIQNPETRTRLQIPVGSVTAKAWRPSTTSVDILDTKTWRVATFQVRSRVGERWT